MKHFRIKKISNLENLKNLDVLDLHGNQVQYNNLINKLSYIDHAFLVCFKPLLFERELVASLATSWKSGNDISLICSVSFLKLGALCVWKVAGSDAK